MYTVSCDLGCSIVYIFLVAQKWHVIKINPYVTFAARQKLYLIENPFTSANIVKIYVGCYSICSSCTVQRTIENNFWGPRLVDNCTSGGIMKTADNKCQNTNFSIVCRWWGEISSSFVGDGNELISYILQ
jgi:hypothetical protein